MKEGQNNAVCLKCGCEDFCGFFDGYSFIWYCSECDREFDGHDIESRDKMSNKDIETILKEE